MEARDGGTTVGLYTYNALGQKVSKEAGGKKTLFFYDLNGNLIAESDRNGSVNSEYIYIDKSIIARADTGVEHLYYYAKTATGAPVLMTDEDGLVLWQANYLPFGEAQVSAHSTVINNLRLPGQYFDEETGLHYSYFRHYHPGIGRFIGPDPIGLEGGINLYAYAFNDPVNLIDPTGQVGIAGIIIGAASGAFGGWVAGMKSGHVWAGIIGGIAGGVVGGAIGFAFPPSSGVVGSIVGGAVAGIIGGGTAGMVGARLSNPEGSTKEILISTAKGAGIGLVAGSITGATGGAVAQVGAGTAMGNLAGTMIALPVEMNLSLVEFDVNWNHTGQEEPIIDVWPETISYPDDWFSRLQWDSLNPQEIRRNSSVTLRVVGGAPPYGWAVSSEGFSLAQTVTQDVTNVLTADDTACGSVTITVSDSAGNTVSGSLREPDHGKWVLVMSQSCADVDLEPGQCNCTKCSSAVLGSFKYVDCWWGGTRTYRYHGPYCGKWPYTEDLSDQCCYCVGFYPCFDLTGLYSHELWQWQCK